MNTDGVMFDELWKNALERARVIDGSHPTYEVVLKEYCRVVLEALSAKFSPPFLLTDSEEVDRLKNDNERLRKILSTHRIDGYDEQQKERLPMITCETPDRMWTIEGKIEVVHEEVSRHAWCSVPGAGTIAYIGIKDLSVILGEHAGKWAKIRVEIEAEEEPSRDAQYPKKADYPDLPFEVVVVKRSPTGKVLHVEVCYRNSLESEARQRAQVLINSGIGGLYTVEIVTPTGMVKA